MSSSSSSWKEISSSSWREPGTRFGEGYGKLVAYSDSEEEEEEEEDKGPRNWHLVFEGAFSHATIEAAIRGCGLGASEEEMLDFMLALQYAPPPAEPAIATDSINSTFMTANGSTHDSDCNPDELVLREMGFKSEQISAAIESCGADASVQTKIAFLVHHASKMEESELNRDKISHDLQKSEEDTLEVLVSWYKYPRQLAQQALDRCDTTELDVLVDYMDAHGAGGVDVAEDDDYEFLDYDALMHSDDRGKKKRRVADNVWSSSRQSMTGFSLPDEPTIPRFLTSEQRRLPFFYFENVRAMPKGAWEEISQNLFGIKPEFVCASHFSVSRRPRGYVHNLPLENRVRLLPVPAQTIREFLPNSVQFTPPWDTREKLHTINTGCGSTFSSKIHESLTSGMLLTEEMLKGIYVLVKKWNLVWVGPNSCAPLDPHEMETALGFNKDHTRTFSHSERYKALGNAFQTDVVGYHLSALRPLFLDGIRVLSLFAGIGGAEVALHRVGIPIKFLVSVEINPICRRILARWWESTNQTGQHIILEDVQDLTEAKLVELMRLGGGRFDLVIGGSPCNNLSGCNRASRTGLTGEKSSLFFEFPRILTILRDL